MLHLKTRNLLNGLNWESVVVDLHKEGIHYHDWRCLPTNLSLETHLKYRMKGLTPPNALPSKFPANIRDRTAQFLDNNYFKFSRAGVQYLGTEAGNPDPAKFDTSELKVCICRISDYYTVDGAFGPMTIANWVEDFDPRIFVDFAFIPADQDITIHLANELPLLFGVITKQPLTAFDVIIFSTPYPGERANIVLPMIKSGIPLYRWERFDSNLPYQKCPLVCVAGIGASFIENLCFHPRTPVLMADGSLKAIGRIGRGELVKTHNEQTGEIEDKPVLRRIYSKPSKKVLKLNIKDSKGQLIELICTEDHPFYTNNRGWVAAKDLTEDDDICEFDTSPEDKEL